ncbi:MAG: 2-hydroxyacyl-CoA dehydratase family protein [Bacillota bacterium]|jgi:benzoyl-CoA reductase/2-hydroxyglutaryl-CoA dehydratase subunit BcrC/BadD/HgdB
MKEIGITTTVPMEIVYAAGRVPVDLNNIFISHPQRRQAIEAAEMDGYPRTVCGWIKGLYGMISHVGVAKTVIAVTEGDCSQTHALMETLEEKGIEIIPFSFPFDSDPRLLKWQLDRLAERLGAQWTEIYRQKEQLDEVRRLVWEIDRLTWQENKVSGFENHLWQICCSDFCGDPQKFARDAQSFLDEVSHRDSFKQGEAPRLGIIGVPTIIDGLYEYLQEMGVQVVFNEVQRQFSMPQQEADLVDQYRVYTYPYHVRFRIADIQTEIKKRRLDAIIHYTQSFCFRQIEDILFRQHLDVPLLTLEGDQPGELDARSRLRLETFIGMLKGC